MSCVVPAFDAEVTSVPHADEADHATTATSATTAGSATTANSAREAEWAIVGSFTNPDNAFSVEEFNLTNISISGGSTSTTTTDITKTNKIPIAVAGWNGSGLYDGVTVTSAYIEVTKSSLPMEWGLKWKLSSSDTSSHTGMSIKFYVLYANQNPN